MYWIFKISRSQKFTCLISRESTEFFTLDDKKRDNNRNKGAKEKMRFLGYQEFFAFLAFNMVVFFFADHLGTHDSNSNSNSNSSTRFPASQGICRKTGKVMISDPKKSRPQLKTLCVPDGDWQPLDDSKRSAEENLSIALIS